jgi:phosphoribosylformylglycinamidine cyclo-ligase
MVEPGRGVAKALRHPPRVTAAPCIGSVKSVTAQSPPVRVLNYLELAGRLDRHETIGIDLVAMCVNDILVSGAEPLFFLDYFATGRLDVDTAETVIKGIARGCEQAGCALIGGETAEMPGMYAAGDYDLAGFGVGIVERDALIDGRDAVPGDVLIGLPASGPHSNGYSLIRKILDRVQPDMQQQCGGQTLAEALMAPTRIYVKTVLGLMDTVRPRAMAHITGGGLVENIPRVLPAGTAAVIDTGAWRRPAVFDWLAENGPLDNAEMLRTFNCGIGLVICVAGEAADAALQALERRGETAFRIGRLEAATDESDRIRIVSDGR